MKSVHFTNSIHEFPSIVKQVLLNKAILPITFFSLLLLSTTALPVGVSSASDAGVHDEAVNGCIVVMENHQSKTVEVEQIAVFDFGIIPVLLIGSGNFSASLARTNTYGEVVFLYIRGFGMPLRDVNVAKTPVTIKVKSSVEENWSVGVVMYGVIYSSEPVPFTYKIKLDF